MEKANNRREGKKGSKSNDIYKQILKKLEGRGGEKKVRMKQIHKYGRPVKSISHKIWIMNNAW